MELVQEVSEIGDYIKDLSNYIILTRRADTSLVVNDGQTVVIGGLMKSNNRKSNAGIPYLKDIPILGYLFGAGTDQIEKTELIIMITPRVIKSKGEADLITREFSEKIRSFRGLDKAQQPAVPQAENAVKPDAGGNIPQ
jgi:general secretion pathway protein D